MMYEIHSRSDFEMGRLLVVRVPEDDFDHKAYQTLQKDWPEFLIPFQCYSVNGEIECTYRLESRMNLRYFYDPKEAREYVHFWQQVLQPLLDCDDWFLKPSSFVLEEEYLYLDKKTNTVSYLYVPSKKDCSTNEMLHQLMFNLARQNQVKNRTDLENRVLREVWQLQPNAFLKMLQSFMPVQKAEQKPIPQPKPQPQPQPESKPQPQPQRIPNPDPQPKPQPKHEPVSFRDDDPGLEIYLEGEGTKKRDGKKGEKKEKHFGLGGLFGKKQQESQVEKEELHGAGAERRQPNAEAHNKVQQGGQLPGTDQPRNHTDFEDTELVEVPKSYLWRVGKDTLPESISVVLEPGKDFRIGRFDVRIGQQQSDFEFKEDTTAVSRKHAVIGRDADGYWIMDLDSKAGTYVDGEKQMPGAAARLTDGTHVSFGNAGADYIWRES